MKELEEEYRLAISVITYLELIVGCRNKSEVKKMKSFLKKFDLMLLNASISETAIDLFDKYQLSHGVLIPDTLIAATALSEEIPLLTKNRKDFRFIENLDLLSY